MDHPFTVVTCPCEAAKKFPITIEHEKVPEKNDSSEADQGEIDYVIDCPKCGELLELRFKGSLPKNQFFLTKR